MPDRNPSGIRGRGRHRLCIPSFGQQGRPMLDQLERAPIRLNAKSPMVSVAHAILRCVAREVVDAVLRSTPTRTEDASVCKQSLGGGDPANGARRHGGGMNPADDSNDAEADVVFPSRWAPRTFTASSAEMDGPFFSPRRGLSTRCALAGGDTHESVRRLGVMLAVGGLASRSGLGTLQRLGS